MAEDKNIVFSAAVRGFHVYKSIWQPKEGESLECSHEEDNPYDMFSIKVFKKDFPDTIIGHLPMEISRITKYIMDRGALVKLKIWGKHYRRSPLVQGGLEIPCRIKITMLGNIVNHLILEKYETLLKELYIEPKEEAIIGTFLSLRYECENANQEDFEIIENMEIEAERAIGGKAKIKPPKKEVKSKDIRDMFKNPKHDNGAVRKRPKK